MLLRFALLCRTTSRAPRPKTPELGRFVALTFLPEDVEKDPQVLELPQRGAGGVSSEHPNKCRAPADCWSPAPFLRCDIATSFLPETPITMNDWPSCFAISWIVQMIVIQLKPKRHIKTSYPLEGRRPRHPHPEGRQGGMRKVAIAEGSSKKSCLRAHYLLIVVVIRRLDHQLRIARG